MGDRGPKPSTLSSPSMGTSEGIPQREPGSSEGWQRGVQCWTAPGSIVHSTSAKGALIEDPPVMNVSQSPSTACHRKFCSSELRCGSQDHSCKMKGLLVNLCLHQILRDLCPCPPKTPPPPYFCMYIGAKKPICPLERGRAVITR